MTKYNLTFSMLMLAGLLVFASGCPQSGTETPSTTSGAGASATVTTAPPASNYKAAADFTFAKYGGDNAKMSSYAGKPLVINFWATW